MATQFERLEDLEIYTLSERIADRFYTLMHSWSPFDRQTVGTQLIRAADSVGANIAESYGRYHYGERIQFLYYARGSLYETRHWLRRARQRHLLDSATCDRAERALEELGIKLNSYIRSKKGQRRRDGSALREAQAPYMETRQPDTFETKSAETEPATDEPIDPPIAQ